MKRARLFWALLIEPVAAPGAAGTGVEQQKSEVRVLGFENMCGALFVVLWVLAEQPSAQMALGFTTAALLAHLKLVNAARDARALNAGFTSDLASALARPQQGLTTTVFTQESSRGWSKWCHSHWHS